MKAAIYVVVMSVVYVIALIVTWALREPVKDKAHKFDEICAYAKRTLEGDARIIRTDAQLADVIVARVNSDRIGDGAQHLEWCLDKPFPLMAWAACRDRQCYASILDDLASAIR